MRIVKDKQLIEDVFEYEVILFGIGINNAMKGGLLYDIAINFPEVSESINNTGYGDRRKYGTIHSVHIQEGCKEIVFCACYCYNLGLLKTKGNDGSFIDYGYLEKCLEEVKKKYGNRKIVSTIIGQDKYDGKGDKQKIISIFEKVFDDKFDITLYDFKQHNLIEETYKNAVDLRRRYQSKKITKENFLDEMKKLEWKRLYGIFKPIDENFQYKPKPRYKQKI